MRPKTLQIYSNRPHIIGFEEADDIPATQSITLSPKDWDETGTATIPLRFVKFQNITSLVIFIVDGEGEGEKVAWTDLESLVRVERSGIRAS
jgi:hypothetical protein